MATRINKYLSEVGYCSRREADRLILEGKVTINGKIPEIGTKVEDCDQVEVKGQKIEKSKRQKNIYLTFTQCKEPPVITTREELKKDAAREEWKNIITQDWRRTEED